MTTAKTPAAFPGALTGVPLEAEGLDALPPRPASALLDLLAPAFLKSGASSQNELQIVHPESGQYDVVLVHSGLPADLAENNSLKGDPIYTVYLDVGMNQNWILHYSSVDPAVYISEHVVRIAGGQKITPPYPRITVVPTQAPPNEPKRRVIVHGSIDAQGCFRELRPLSDLDQSSCTRLAPLLEKWHFRPATQSGVPVAVDIVMVIPPVQ